METNVSSATNVYKIRSLSRFGLTKTGEMVIFDFMFVKVFYALGVHSKT
jgi:hypothetical protein